MVRIINLFILLAFLFSVSAGQQDSVAYRAAIALTKPEERLRALEEFVAAHPESKLLTRAYDGLFDLYANSGSEANAVRAAVSALATLQPDALMSPYNRFAYALAERGMGLDSALVWIDRAIELAERTKSRNLAAYQDTKAYVLYKLGRPIEAEELQRIAIKGNEDDPEFLAHLALYQRANKKLDDALTTMVKALYYGGEPDVKEDFLRWIDEVEEGKRASDKTSIVMTTLHSLIDTMKGPPRVAARSRCAMVMADLGVDLHTAEHWAEAAVNSLDKSSSLADVIVFRQSLALVLSTQGKRREALVHLRKIEDLVDPYDARFWLTLGQTYAQVGDSVNAEGAYMKGLVARSEKRLRGAVVGSLVNTGIIMISGSIIAPPQGADVTTAEGLKAVMHLFEPKHFVMPFLAHALGTFVGALVAAVIAARHKMKFALGIGVFFLIGGITNVLMLPSPVWFTIVDLAGAYLPMGYLAGKLIAKQAEP